MSIATAPETYRGSITREQWLIDETRTVARLMADEGITADADLVARVTSQNLFCYPTEREQASIARACARRLRALSNDPDTRDRAIDLVAHGTPDQHNQTNLYAMMRDNRLVWDFMLCLVARKLETLDTTLRRYEIADFLEGLRVQNERVDTWSDATLNKVRQVLTACLVNCGMYDRAAEQLKPLLLDYDLELCMRANGDNAVLRVFGMEG